MPDSSQTTLFAAQKNVLAAVENQVDQLNTALKEDYLNVEWVNYVMRFQAGQPTTAPTPPHGYIVGYQDDPTAPGVQWAFPTVGTVPVCAMPPLPVAPVAALPSNGPTVSQVGDKMNVPAGDTLPSGSQITAPDGSVWKKMATLTPFGVAHYYQRVS